MGQVQPVEMMAQVGLALELAAAAAAVAGVMAAAAGEGLAPEPVAGMALHIPAVPAALADRLEPTDLPVAPVLVLVRSRAEVALGQVR